MPTAGVQVLKADGTTPVTFTSDPNQAINTGTTTGTSYAISTPASSGNMQGVGTYTLNYQ